MENFFQKLVNFDQNVLSVILLVIFFSLEQLLSKPLNFNQRIGHLLHSIALQLGYVLVNFCITFLLVACFQWLGEHRIGLLYQLSIPYGLKVIIGVLCFDFTFYWAHRLYHVLPVFWRLHRVHHSDNRMDSTTSFRFHPFDALLDSTMSVIAAAIFGLDINIILFFFVLYLPLLFAQHCSFTFPDWSDKLFGKILVAPNFHKVHHHQKQVFTDSNYGNLFIIWDRFFGTFKCLPVKEIKYGLEEFDDPKKQTAWYLIKSPFLKISRINKENKPGEA
jgi:sterol desaturase/sphingolipid hydroxylase (fatty acid hydroxylase superfamily)